jgi:hypothetical protein
MGAVVVARNQMECLSLFFIFAQFSVDKGHVAKAFMGLLEMDTCFAHVGPERIHSFVSSADGQI